MMLTGGSFGACLFLSMKQWIKAILILPFNVLVILPALVLYAADYHFTPPTLWRGVCGGILLAAGGTLAVWTMRLFARYGRGTPAPWAPPQKLVLRGPYLYVRNPMITAVLAMLLAEALLLSSRALFGLFLAFWAVNMLYLPLSEEKGLARRFGAEYEEYKKAVPRWLPRLTPWKK